MRARTGRRRNCILHPDSQVFFPVPKARCFLPTPAPTHTHTHTRKFISWKNLISGSEPVMELNHKMEPCIAETVHEGEAANGGGGAKRKPAGLRGPVLASPQPGVQPSKRCKDLPAKNLNSYREETCRYWYLKILKCLRSVLCSVTLW